MSDPHLDIFYKVIASVLLLLISSEIILWPYLLSWLWNANLWITITNDLAIQFLQVFYKWKIWQWTWWTWNFTVLITREGAVSFLTCYFWLAWVKTPEQLVLTGNIYGSTVVCPSSMLCWDSEMCTISTTLHNTVYCTKNNHWSVTPGRLSSS